MKIFISHSSKDLDIVAPLVTLLESALKLDSSEIRCSSLPGYGFLAGSELHAKMRSEVKEFEIFLGIITPNSLDSIYVIFELGGRWIGQKNLTPLISSYEMKKYLKDSPLDNIYRKLYDEDDLHVLIDQLGEILNRKPGQASAYRRHIKSLCESVERFNNSNTKEEVTEKKPKLVFQKTPTGELEGRTVYPENPDIRGHVIKVNHVSDSRGDYQFSIEIVNHTDGPLRINEANLILSSLVGTNSTSTSMWSHGKASNFELARNGGNVLLHAWWTPPSGFTCQPPGSHELRVSATVHGNQIQVVDSEKVMEGLREAMGELI